MPAPIAKGLIISLSLLFAAGLAVYESPQVRQWIDESRRKIAVALHSLGDEVQPRRESRNEDASTREDSSAEAEARRQKAREEILEKGRLMEERRKARQEKMSTRARNFDDLVDQDGNLKNEKSAAINTTAVELTAGDEGLRKRNTEAKEQEMISVTANPVADETLIDFNSSESVTSTTRNSQDLESGARILSPSTLADLPSSERPQDAPSTVYTNSTNDILIQAGINPAYLTQTQLETFHAVHPEVQKKAIRVYAKNMAQQHRSNIPQYIPPSNEPSLPSAAQANNANDLLIQAGFNPSSLSQTHLESFYAQSPQVQKKFIQSIQTNEQLQEALSGNHALQDYHMQLMLLEMRLEQRNEKREQEAVRSSNGRSTAGLPSSPPGVYPSGSRSNPSSNLHLTTNETSNLPSDQLVDLGTPTTSTLTAHHDELSELADQPSPPQALHYWSVNEWAETTSASFYTPPQSETGRETQQPNTSTTADDANVIGEHAYTESDIDVVSEMSEGRSTPGSWTEVGSVVSEYE